jgi:hypothetical protein
VEKEDEGVPVKHPRFPYPDSDAALFDLRDERSHSRYEPVLQASWAS